MEMMKNILLCVLVLFLTGCSNGFQKHYTPEQNTMGINSNTQSCAVPEVRPLPKNVSDSDLEVLMFEKGYVLIGSANWNGAERSDKYDVAHASEQGKKVLACLVLWSRVYSGEEESITPITTYTPSTTTTTTTWDGKTEIVTTPRSESTEYITTSISLADYKGLFYAKLKDDPQSLGIAQALPPTSYMQLIDSRTGILVKAVQEGSKAYKANIFKGDIIAKINGIPCEYGKPLPTIKNSENEIEVFRNGKTITKKIILSQIDN